MCFNHPFALFLLSIDSVSNGKFEKLFEVFQMQISKDWMYSQWWIHVCLPFWGILMVWTMYEMVSKARIYRCLIFQTNGTIEFELAVTKVYEYIFSGNTFIRYS